MQQRMAANMVVPDTNDYLNDIQANDPLTNDSRTDNHQANVPRVHGYQDNGHQPKPQLSPLISRAQETDELIDAVKQLIIPFIKAADESCLNKPLSRGPLNDSASERRNVLVNAMRPGTLVQHMKFTLPSEEGRGKDGLLDAIQSILDCSVNTWDQGFMDKLTSSTNPVGVVSELLLAVLNTNVHVYHVSPALTIIEKVTARSFAARFGLEGPNAGGMTCQGGSSSNMTSLVIARGALYPDTKTKGNNEHDFVIFTSEHGHYSVEKAAMACGMGMSSVIKVPGDAMGRMDPVALWEMVLQAKAENKTPLYVNATAGTTVHGAYDPLRDIGAICRKFGMWFHVDGSWGGCAAWSSAQKHKMDGSELADSLTVNPHKMLNVPMTCSFLLTNDVRLFHQANTLPAGYLFHDAHNPTDEIWDLADLTLQCGRRADSLKLALAWIYYGAAGFERSIDTAFSRAAYLAALIEHHSNFWLVSSNPPPCLQVCFYYAPDGESPLTNDSEVNTQRTVAIVEKILSRGFMIDYAPGCRGQMFRVVVNSQTLSTTVEGLVKALEEAGSEGRTS